MNQKILLINFTKTESDKLKSLPLEVDRGYLSNISGDIGSIEYLKENIGKLITYYFPYSIHEYKVIFVNFSTKNIEELRKEFDKKIEPYEERRINEFIDYWLIKKYPVVIFLDDYDLHMLSVVGVRGLVVEKVRNRDKTVQSTAEFNGFFEKIKKEVKMPTYTYIKVGEDEKDFYVKFKFACIKKIYCNTAGEMLAVYHNNSPYLYHCNPSLFLLPQFKDNIKVVKGLLKELAKIYSEYLPELYQPNWQELDKYFPQKITSYDERINDIITLAHNKIKQLENEKQQAKEHFQSLFNLLTKKHNEFKQSVIDVLTNIFRVTVIDMDKEKTSTLAYEDIIVEIKGEKILVEIKGDGAQNPSQSHPGQVWKHLTHSTNIKTGALILNYDIKTEPDERSLAYTSELESEVDGIIFIDTRVMYKLALAIVDYGMPIEQAVKILFQIGEPKKGRVEFDFETYIKEKQDLAE